MKKILIAILSLIAALVMCFAFVACDGDHDNPPNGVDPGATDKKDPADDGDPSDDESGKAVSIKLNDALEAINGVLDSKGFIATASYTVSSKNTKTETDSISIEKRGSKIKIEGDILDYETGYWYEHRVDGKYIFDQVLTAGDVDYAKYLAKYFVDEDADGAITARYDDETKTVKFSVNLADNVNKYLDPLYSAYAKSKKIGDILDDYSKLLFGKKFDEVYDLIEAYIKNPENTFGSLLDMLEEKMGVGLEELLAEFDFEIPAEIMTAVKSRKLGEAVVGAYNYIMKYVQDVIGGMMPTSESADVDDVAGEESEAGMESFAMGLLDALLSDTVSQEQIETTLAEIKGMMSVLKELSVKTLIDLAFANEEQPSELYTVIKDGVKFNDISMTVTLTVDDNKAVTGIKADCLVAHTYKGTAAEGSFLADNDYFVSYELKIDEYKTDVADFDIKFSDRAEYKTSVAQVVYEFTENDISVYFETAGNKVDVSAVEFEKYTQDGVTTKIENVPDNAFMFDEATSSYVFNAAFVKSVLENSPAGTYLHTRVCFDNDDNNYYYVTLVYLNDDIEEVSSYLADYFMSIIKNNIGGSDSDAPNVSSPQE